MQKRRLEIGHVRTFEPTSRSLSYPEADASVILALNRDVLMEWTHDSKTDSNAYHGAGNHRARRSYACRRRPL